jgi:hypothetical protein
MPKKRCEEKVSSLTVYALYIHLADNEWGNATMDELAREALEDPKHPDKQPLVVTVHEHAGWFLCYAKLDGEILVVGSANDGAAYYGKVAEFRARVRSARWENIGSIRRPAPAPTNESGA